MKTTLVIALLLFTFSTGIAQSKLNRAKSDLSGSSDKSTSYGNNDGDIKSAENHDGVLNGIVFEFLYFATYGVLIGELQPRYFHSYPFAEGNNGEYAYPENEVGDRRSTLLISNTISVQSGTFANDLNLSYRFIPALGIRAKHLRFFDNRNKNEQMGVTSFVLDFYRIRERNVTGYWGIGGSYVGDGVDTWGFAYNLGLDIYVANPVSLDFYWKQSFINESSINEFRGLARYHLKRLEIHGGYIYHKLGEERFPSAAFGIGYRF